MTEEEIITALEVTPGSTDDGKQLVALLEQTTANGINVSEIIADTAYSGKANLARMKKEKHIACCSTELHRSRGRPASGRLRIQQGRRLRL